jgi:tetratricopeptide (TPR) repeat protein
MTELFNKSTLSSLRPRSETALSGVLWNTLPLHRRNSAPNPVRRMKMKRLPHFVLAGLIVAWLSGGEVGIGHAAQPGAGQAAPLFALKDTQGKAYQLVDMKDQPLLIVYFFDVNSRPSQEGLMNLDQLARNYKESNLIVWGVTRSDQIQVKSFMARSKLEFPILVDNGTVSDLYGARMVLPTVCIIGPDLKILDFLQGGGKTTDSMLLSLAEHSLRQRNTGMAKALSDEVVRKNPDNAQARTVKGYAELKEGDLKSAENTFYNLSRSKGEGEVLGKEGLTQVYAQKGQPEKALQMADEIEQKTGQRAYTHVVKGDLLYSQNKPEQAEAEYRKAISKKEGHAQHRAAAYNQLGRIYAIRGDYKQSLQMYDQAVALDPFYVEATSNKGMAYERQGLWSNALEAYRKAQTIDRNDPFATTLTAHANEMILLEKDPDRRQNLESRIATCVQRYKAQAEDPPADQQDPWTSGPMIMTLMEPVESGGLSRRDGFSRVLALHMALQLNASGRIRIVEPILIERVLETLGLSQGDLADEAVAARLAKAFGATLIGKGTLYHLSDGTLLSLKLIDIRKQRTSQLIERQFASAATLKNDMHWLNRQLLTAVMSAYPLKAFVVEVTGHQILMNLGANQGVVLGALFDIVEEKPEMDYKGKKFTPEPSVMATIEVVKVDAEFAYAYIKEQRRPIRTEDKLRERAQALSEDGQKIW